MEVLFENFQLFDRDGIWTMGVKGGIIESLEHSDSFDKDIHAFSKSYDLKGRYLLPGFSDAHMHFSMLACFFSAVSLEDIRSIKDLKEKLRQEIKDDLTLGWGFDHERFREKRMPTKDDLDEVSRKVPIIIYRFDGHMCVGNSKLLEISNLNKDSKDPEGGSIGRFPNGDLNGILIDNAIPIKGLLNNPSVIESFHNNFLFVQELLLSMGLTSITDMGIGFNTLKSYRDWENAGKIKIRGSLYLSEECLDHREKITDELSKGELLKIRGIKLFADGSLGSRGAALFEEYSDDPGNTGIIRTPLERLEGFVEKADELGLQVAIHAIGDKALSHALTALSKSKNKGLRHRIEHIQLVNNHLLNKLKELDIVAVIQPLFIKSDSLWAENRLGKERIHFSYPLKSLLDNNIKVAASSDSPVETPNPFLGLFFCVSHKDLEGNGHPEWIKKERIGIEDAIKMYTEGASYALFENKGRIEKGMFADFIVLPENPAKIEVEKIKDLKVLKTFVNGELVYSSVNN